MPPCLACRGDPEVLRSEPEPDAVACLDLVLELGRAEHVGGKRHVDVLAAEAPAGRGRLEPAVDQVHRRGAEEGGDEHVGGPAVDLLGRPDLLQHALAHDRDPAAHGHRLDLVVGDVHRRDPEPLVELDQLQPRLQAELRVEVGEGLVHQERLGLPHDRPRERDALPLPARQLAREALEEFLEREDPGGPLHGRLDLALGLLRDAEREGDVLVHRHVRVQRVVLEYHRDVPLHRIDEVDEPVADHDFAGGGILEAGDHAEDRALPAARRPEQHQKLAVLDLEGDVADGLDLAEALDQVLDQDVSHGAPSCRWAIWLVIA